MDPETEKIIKEQWKYLPDEVKNFFTDPKWVDKISDIGKKNGLTDEQILILQTETILVMLGLSDIDLYSGELKTRLQIDEEKVKNIISEIDVKIFGNLKIKLKEIFKETELEPLGPLEIANEETEKQIKELPKTMQDIINSLNWKKILLEIGKNYYLSPEKLATLQVETAIVLTGFENLTEYAQEVEKKAWNK